MLASFFHRRSFISFVIALSLASLLLLFALFVFILPTAQAQSSDNECVGVDLIVLVDESGSMLTNDPAHLRANAARNAIGSLGDNALYFCPGVQHRVAVVGFWDERDGGVDTLPYIETALISPTLEGKGLMEWRTERQELYELLPDRTDSPGATDYRSGFETASEILKKWQANPPTGSNAPRRRGVVLVADGGPCVYDLGCDVNENTMNTAGYMRDLARYLDPNGAEFPWRGEDNPESVRVWFVGFRDSTTSSAYDYLNPDSDVGSAVVPVWRQIARDHGGTFEVLEAGSDNTNTRNSDVAVKVANILEVISEKPAIRVSCDQPFYVNPYTDRLVVQILKIGADQGKEPEDVDVTLQYTGPLPQASLLRGEVIQGSANIDDYTADGPNERYSIANVQPGAWRVLVTNGVCRRDVDVRILPLAARGGVLSPLAQDGVPQYDTAPFSDPVNPAYLNYKLETNPPSGETGQQSIEPVKILPDFPLTISGTVKGPQGDVQQLDLQRQADGSWQSTEPMPVPTAGQYEWEIAAIAPNGAQTGTVAIREDSGSFTVTPVEHFNFKVLSPQAGEQLPVNEVGGGRVTAVPVVVQAQVVDATGAPMSQEVIDSLLVKNTGLFSVTVRSDLGDVAQTIPLAYNSVKNIFEASVRQEADLAQGALDPAGSYSIDVEINPKGYQRLKYRPDSDNIRSTIERYTVIPVAVKTIPTAVQASTYKGSMGCIGAKPVSFDTMLQFTNAQTGETLSPAVIAANPVDLVKVQLLTNGTEEEVQPGVVELFTSDQGPVLRAVLGGEDPEIGEYVVRAQLNPAALNAQYKLLNEEALTIPVTRTLAITDNPATCRTGGGFLLVLLIGLALFMLFTWKHRPVGMLSLVDSNTNMALKDYSLGRSFRLFFMRKQKLSANSLESFGIKRIEAKKAKAETSHRAIEMEVFDQEGTSLGTTIMESGSENLVTYEVTAKYD